MSDLDSQINQLEGLRATLPADAAKSIDEAIVALRARQRIEASDGGSVSNAQQASAGGDMRDNALGSGALVLHDITIAEGGTLLVGATPADLLPKPQAIQRALTTYLRTLFERYRHLSLQGLGADGVQQMRIGVRAVFVNLRTNVTIGEADTLFSEDIATGRASLYRPVGQPSDLSADLRQWLHELLTRMSAICL